jgi:hypothetical protein
MNAAESLGIQDAPFGHAEQDLVGLVPADVATVPVEYEENAGYGIDDALGKRLLAAQRLFGALALGDIMPARIIALWLRCASQAILAKGRYSCRQGPCGSKQGVTTPQTPATTLPQEIGFDYSAVWLATAEVTTTLLWP